MSTIRRTLVRLFGRRIECPVCQEGSHARAIGDAYVCPEVPPAGQPMSLAEARRCAEAWRHAMEGLAVRRGQR